MNTHDNIKLFLKNYNNCEEALVNLDKIIENKPSEKNTIRYEDKYLEKIRMLSDEYILTEDEKIDKETFQKNATKNNQTMSEYIRTLAIKGTKRK